ncbi:MAG: CtsR family transcriptional regulator [Oscillospiraceae bacterium]|nr:CtsR family transcriptional regulator [Oscillospiraceae bacterium]
MATSDLIAEFIMSALDDSGGYAELQRSALAEMFSCVPGQINYVISTRFSPERGYVVESRRGGGGYIRITRVHQTPQELVMHMVNSVGDRLSLNTAAAFVSNLLDAGIIDKPTARLMLSAVSANALRPVEPEGRDAVRASIFKQMLVNYISF